MPQPLHLVPDNHILPPTTRPSAPHNRIIPIRQPHRRIHHIPRLDEPLHRQVPLGRTPIPHPPVIQVPINRQRIRIRDPVAVEIDLGVVPIVRNHHVRLPVYIQKRDRRPPARVARCRLEEAVTQGLVGVVRGGDAGEGGDAGGGGRVAGQQGGEPAAVGEAGRVDARGVEAEGGGEVGEEVGDEGAVVEGGDVVGAWVTHPDVLGC